MVVTFEQCDISTQGQHALKKANSPLSTLYTYFQTLATIVLHSRKLCLVSRKERDSICSMAFCVWLISFGTNFSGFIHFPADDGILSLFMAD